MSTDSPLIGDPHDPEVRAIIAALHRAPTTDTPTDDTRCLPGICTGCTARECVSRSPRRPQEDR